METSRHVHALHPERRDAIDRLIETDSSFAELCREYDALAAESRHLEHEVDSTSAPTNESVRMRDRFKALEEKITASIEASLRIL